MSMINREELLAAIMDDGGIQYPRWWYVDKVKTAPEAVVLCKDCVHHKAVGHCEYFCMFVESDDYCSKGRRDDGGK